MEGFLIRFVPLLLLIMKWGVIIIVVVCFLRAKKTQKEIQKDIRFIKECMQKEHEKTELDPSRIKPEKPDGF